MSKLVSIIVLNHNGRKWLEQCIPTIKQQTYSPIEIIVTDNASTDDSLEYLKQFPEIKILHHSKNLGYTTANNLGGRAATGEYLFFLNNDTKLYPHTIEKLVKHHKPKAVSNGHQHRPWETKEDGSSGAGMDIFGYPYVEDDPRKTHVFYADGAMIFVRKKDFFEIGGFDDELFIFEEDIDFSWRAQIMGYSVISCWDAHLVHFGGSTVPGNVTKDQKYVSNYFRRYLNEKNVVRNILKNYSFPLCLIILVVLMGLHLAEFIVLTLLGKWKAAECYLKSYAWNIKNLGNTLQFRKTVQRKRTVSDWELMKRMYKSYSKWRAFQKLGFPEFK